MDVERACSGPCGRSLPLDQFGKDARKPHGRRYVCKRCDREATRKRRAGLTPKPGALALVLTPRFPTPPEIPSPTAEGVPATAPDTTTEQPGRVGSYGEAVEEFIAALDPPAGGADALLVRNLRGLAELADQAAFREEPTRELTSLTTALVRVQRELAATRIAKAKAPAEEKPAPRSAANY